MGELSTFWADSSRLSELDTIGLSAESEPGVPDTSRSSEVELTNLQREKITIGQTRELLALKRFFILKGQLRKLTTLKKNKQALYKGKLKPKQVSSTGNAQHYAFRSKRRAVEAT